MRRQTDSPFKHVGCRQQHQGESWEKKNRANPTGQKMPSVSMLQEPWRWKQSHMSRETCDTADRWGDRRPGPHDANAGSHASISHTRNVGYLRECHRCSLVLSILNKHKKEENVLGEETSPMAPPGRHEQQRAHGVVDQPDEQQQRHADHVHLAVPVEEARAPFVEPAGGLLQGERNPEVRQVAGGRGSAGAERDSGPVPQGTKQPCSSVLILARFLSLSQTLFPYFRDWF